MKTCTSCRKQKPDTDFPSKGRRNGVTVRRTKCRRCYGNRKKAQRVANQPDPVAIPSKAPKADRYVVTWAQNKTPVHGKFLDALHHYCVENGATLLAIPGRYRNPTSPMEAAYDHDEWWDDRIVPYLNEGKATLFGLQVRGDISIRPTAVNPLTGWEVVASDAVFGHPKIQFRTIARGARKLARIHTTTGAVTQANYSKGKAGKKAAEHHVIGACVVEKGKDSVHVRQINAKPDGSFIDLEWEYTPDGVRPAEPALALVCGDIHVAKSDHAVLGATLYDRKSIAYTLKPQRIVYHDMLDNDARGHHERNNFFDRYLRSVGHRNDSVKEEIRQAVSFIDSTPKGDGWDPEIVHVASNHPDGLDKLINDFLTGVVTLKHDHLNALFLLETSAKVLRHARDTGKEPIRDFNAFELLYRDSGQRDVTFVHRDENYEVAGIECGYHGDKGINGARGSVHGHRKLGCKTIIGHVHSPAISDGVYAVGITGSLDQGYNTGPSGWLHTHCAVYANGKRCLITVLPSGEWRADR